MGHLEFMGLLRAIYTSMLSGIQELQTQNAILVEVLQTLQ